MISRNLLDDLKEHLKNATELWVAVALLKDTAFTKMQKCINTNVKQHWLVGIDLPTTPSVLKLLQAKQPTNFTAKIYNRPETYHPKVYLIKNKDGYVAFVGSANATEGGFSKNVELSYCITDQNDCKAIEDWFNSINNLGKEITDEFLATYELTYKKNLFLSSVKKSNNDNLKGLDKPIKGGNIIIDKGQFFRQSDFVAFSTAYHTDKTKIARENRRLVRERFLHLDDLIFERFNEYNIFDLHHPNCTREYTSQYYHTARNSPIKDAIWLHYGKSINQLEQSKSTVFTENIRMQIILRNNSLETFIGIWLFIGKPKGSKEDRSHLKNSLKVESFLSILFDKILLLGNSYWISIGNQTLNVSDISDSNKLKNFLYLDDYKSYFKIGRNYQPNDSDLTIDNIEETVLTEFSKLYKIYDLIKAT